MERAKGWVTKKAAAEFLSVSKRTLERWIARRYLRLHRVGGVGRLRWSDVLQFQARAEAGAFA